MPAGGARHQEPLIFVHRAAQTGTVCRQLNLMDVRAIFIRYSSQTANSVQRDD